MKSPAAVMVLLYEENYATVRLENQYGKLIDFASEACEGVKRWWFNLRLNQITVLPIVVNTVFLNICLFYSTLAVYNLQCNYLMDIL